MGAIWTSRTRSRQPHGAVGVNWGSPLARNLKIAWSGRFPTWNAATNKASIELINAPPQVSTPYGVGVQLNGSNQSVNLNAKLGTSAGSWYLLMVDAVSLSTGEGVLSQSTDDAGSGVSLGISQGYARAGSSSAYLFDSGTTEPMKAVGGTWNSTAVKSFSLGVLKDSGGGTSAPSNPAGNYFAHIGAYHYSGGRIFHKALTPVAFFYWDRALSDAEMAHVHSSPWQLFAPQRTARIYSFPTAGGGATVAVPAGALTLTGYAPTVAATAHQTIAVPKGALVLSAFAPTVSTSAAQTIAVPAASLTLTGFAPTVAATANQSISVPAGSLTLTGYAPTVYTTAVTTIAVPAGTLTLTGYAPTVSYTTHAYIGVPAGALALTGYAPTVTGGESSIWTPASASSGTWTPASASGGTWTPQ